MSERQRARHALPAGVLVAFTVAVFAVVGTADATPGTPGTPQPGTVVYQEDFTSGSPMVNTTPSGVTGYTGGSAANGSSYSTSPAWAPTANNCNGWVVNSTTAIPGSDTGCSTGGGAVASGTAPANAWTFLRAMAYAIGKAQGMTGTDLTKNNAIASQTNGGSVLPAGDQTQLQSNLSTPAVAGHYYAPSVWFAAIHCPNDGYKPGGATWYAPIEHMYLLEGTSPSDPSPSVFEATPSAGINVCTSPASSTTNFSTNSGSIVPGTFSIPVHVNQLAAVNATQAPAGVTSLGLRVTNSQNQSTGNDGAFDTPTIVDITPQLDKSFAPATVAPGVPSTLTFTMTNTAELLGKLHWTFTDTLPSGLTVQSGTTPVTDCTNGSPSVTADGTSFTMTGDLEAGEPSCTVSVQVVSGTPGTYTNGPGNVSTFGLLAPGTTELNVTQSAQVTKAWVVKDTTGAVVGTYHVPAQPGDTAPTLPAGFAAEPTLTGHASAAFGTVYGGYTVGQDITIGEGPVTVPAGCTVDSQQLTDINGTAMGAPPWVPFMTTVTPGPTPNTYTITNTVTCTQTLTLVKEVAFGKLSPSSWTLTGTGPAGALPGPDGATGTPGATEVNVTPGAAYTLAETSAVPGSANYIAAGWVCTSGGATVPVTDSKVTLAYGQSATCTVTNTTAQMTVLKHIVDPENGLTAGQFNLTVTPPTGTASTFAGSETATTGNTMEVLPGATYTLSEATSDSATAYLALGLQSSADGGLTWVTVPGNQVTPMAGTAVMYRFVNQSAPAVALPTTGGVGLDTIAYGSLGLLCLVALLVVAHRRLRRTRT